MSNIRTSEVLQSHFSTSDQNYLMDNGFADKVIRLDVSDCDDPCGAELDGIDCGIDLYLKLLEVRKIKGNEDAGIYKLTFGDYGDEDGTALFIGTHVGLQALFLANPSKKLTKEGILSQLGTREPLKPGETDDSATHHNWPRILRQSVQ